MSKKQILVSICIPHYNNKATIAETLNSLLDQTYKNIIIKIFDNASTDGSIEILKNYEKNFKNIQVYQNKTNIGGEANFTKCIQHLEGDYGAIYHADDLYSPTMVEEQIRFLQSHPECSAVATHGYLIDENSNIIGFRPIPDKYLVNKDNIIDGKIDLLKEVLKYGSFITCPSVMGKVDIYKNKVKSWNGEDFKTAADLDVWFRFAEFGKFGLISKPLIKYRESTSSYSYRDMRTRIGENNMFLVLDFYMNKYKNKLNKKDVARYKFLLFKDNVNRTINEIIQGKKGDLVLNIFDKEILSIACESKRNLKIYIVGLIMKIIRNFELSTLKREKLFFYRFNKKL